MNREIIRQHICVSGRVQGVGFRFRTMQFASQLKLAGWVRNLDDGRVELELEG
jgi:acylphosphatase